MNEGMTVVFSYEPAAYLDVRLEHQVGDYRVVLENGEATVYFPAGQYQLGEDDVGHWFDTVGGFLDVVLFLKHRPYELRRSGYRVIRPRPDGTEDVTLGVAAVETQAVGESVRVVIANERGEVTGDSSQAERRELERFLVLVATYRGRDQTLRSILDSYGEAVNDPAHELVHLYAVYDAMKRRFGGERRAIAALDGVPNWGKLRKLANNPEIRQGRHVGQHAGQLRDATPEELLEARAIARAMITSYLDFLEQQSAD